MDVDESKDAPMVCRTCWMNFGHYLWPETLAPERLTDEARKLAIEARDTDEVREKLGASKRGKPLHPNAIAAQRVAVKKPKSEEWKRAASERMKKVWEHPEQHGLPPCHHWTDDEIALL